MTDPDILIRLRKSDGGYFMRSMFIEAADEIERLRAEIDRKNLTIQALTEERNEVVRMANKLAAERDEARREVCNLLWQKWSGTETQVAEQRGWDCFKENTNG